MNDIKLYILCSFYDCKIRFPLIKNEYKTMIYKRMKIDIYLKKDIRTYKDNLIRTYNRIINEHKNGLIYKSIQRHSNIKRIKEHKDKNEYKTDITIINLFLVFPFLQNSKKQFCRDRILYTTPLFRELLRSAPSWANLLRFFGTAGYPGREIRLFYSAPAFAPSVVLSDSTPSGVRRGCFPKKVQKNIVL